MKIHFIAFAIATVLPNSAFAAAYTLFSDRQAFSAMTGVLRTDDYENANYQDVMTDAAMSAVFGETRYFTYGGNVTDYNNILDGFGVGGSHAYCSLCYGSVRLSFDNTSLTTGGGVFGVGMDIVEDSAGALPFTYSAMVTFADGSANTFQLPYVAPSFPNPPVYQFWGIISGANVRSIDLITHSASGEDRTYLIIDNLTIAAVPEPSALALFGLGSAVIIGMCWGRRNFQRCR